MEETTKVAALHQTSPPPRKRTGGAKRKETQILGNQDHNI